MLLRSIGLKVGGTMWAATRRFVIACLALAVLPVPIAFASDATDHRLFSPHSAPYGRSYQEWYAEYQEWLNEIPTPANPLTDPASPENCDVEDGRITFIFDGAKCKVSKDKAVAFTGAFWECSTAEGLGDTYAELRRCAVENFEKDLTPDVLQFTIRIDGQIVRNPRRWTVITPIPSDLINFPEDNIWGAEPGPSKSVTKGQFYILRPLSAGTHMIRVNGHAEGFGDFTVTYQLRVV
jgi:hypothetical protein